MWTALTGTYSTPSIYSTCNAQYAYSTCSMDCTDRNTQHTQHMQHIQYNAKLNKKSNTIKVQYNTDNVKLSTQCRHSTCSTNCTDRMHSTLSVYSTHTHTTHSHLQHIQNVWCWKACMCVGAVHAQRQSHNQVHSQYSVSSSQG